MSVFCVYKPDGSIIQCNKVYDPADDHEDRMRELGQTFKRLERPDLVSAEYHYFLADELTDRPTMPITVSKEQIEAGGTDSVVFLGIPKNARLQVFNNIPGVGTVNPYDLPIPDGEFEYAIDMPCLFTVQFSLWPYRDWKMEFEATAP